MDYLLPDDKNSIFLSGDFINMADIKINPVTSKKKASRLQHYRTAWQKNPLFENWLTAGSNSRKARCTACCAELTADISALKYHAASTKHRLAIEEICGEAPTGKYSAEKLIKKGIFNPQWLLDDKYGSWISPGSTEKFAYCNLCEMEMVANTSSLRRHMSTQTHIKASGI